MTLGWLSIIGLFAFLAIVVGGIATIAGGGGGGGNGDGGGKLAEKPQKEEEPQPQKEDQAQGGQQEQQEGGGQEPEPQKPEPQKPSFGDGTYQVGADIQPGTYRTRVGSPNCYWERLRNFSGGINGILANGGTSAPA